jgi:hypothetical protein
LIDQWIDGILRDRFVREADKASNGCAHRLHLFVGDLAKHDVLDQCARDANVVL